MLLPHRYKKGVSKLDNDMYPYRKNKNVCKNGKGKEGMTGTLDNT
jgi:hypothetical protein